MNKKRSYLILVLFSFFLSSHFPIQAQTIEGTSLIKLKSAVTPQTKQKQRLLAMDSLTNSLVSWINDFFGNSFDPNNPIYEKFINKLLIACKANVQEQFSIQQRDYIIKLTVPNNVLDSIIASYNTHFDTLALHYWYEVTEALKANNYQKIYTSGLQSLYYSMAHIGSPIETPEIPGTQLTKQVRLTVQKILKAMDISLGNPIITGKPPNLAKENLSLELSIASKPLTNIPLVALLPNERKLFSFTTDMNGRVSLAKFKVPFVPRGAILYIQPDFATILGSSTFISAQSLGLKLTENINQTLMFNIIKPVYTLEYSAIAVNQLEIPVVFTEPTFIHNFLKDSCSLQPGNKQDADIAIKINCQVLNYTYDELEETRVKVEANVIVNELKPGGSQAESAVSLYEKAFGYNETIPLGLFFWESSNHLRNLIKETLDKL